MAVRKCNRCNQKFILPTRSYRICKSCRYKTCLYCKKQFNDLKVKRGIFCSAICKYTALKEGKYKWYLNEQTKQKMSKARLGVRLKKYLKKECVFCNKTFEVTPSRQDAKYCTQSCRSRVIGLKMKEKWAKRRTIKHCLMCNTSISLPFSRLKRNKFCSQHCLGVSNILQQARSKKPTSIEQAVYNALKQKGILFEQQKNVGGRWVVDAYIPSLNIVIECDGKYWHSLTEVQKRDVRKSAFLSQNGYQLLRFTEKEINDGSFINKLPN